jgi:hypothetical protein
MGELRIRPLIRINQEVFPGDMSHASGRVVNVAFAGSISIGRIQY